MQSRRVLIVYSSSYGQTAKIARRMADMFVMEWGDTVTLLRAGAVPRDVVPGNFDAVIVGGSVLFGRHQRSLVRFVRAHRIALNAVPSAFFSVSGTAANRDEMARKAVQQYVDQFLRATRWSPALTETFGGAMAFTKYNPILRWVIKRISAKRGGPTDTSRDHEVTDWTAVERFVRAIAAIATGRRTHGHVPAGVAVLAGGADADGGARALSDGAGAKATTTI